MEDSYRQFITDGEDAIIQNLMSNLEFIARIKSEEKVDLATMSMCPNSWFYSFYRTIITQKESRTATLEFIKTTINISYDKTSELLNRPDKYCVDLGKQLIDHIRDSKNGLINMSKTKQYSNDVMFSSKLKTTVKNIDTKLCILENILKNKHSSPMDIISKDTPEGKFSYSPNDSEFESPCSCGSNSGKYISC